ncbi:MAG: SDR family oxidoreductase [Halobacteria archaeon]
MVRGRLSGKVAVVAGAGAGIGRATAVLFAREGARVVVAARTAARVEETARMARKGGGEAVAAPADLTREGDVASLFAKAETAYGGLDIVVNSAGGFAPKPLQGTDPATFDEMVALNLRTVFLTTRLAVEPFEKRGGGAIVNMSAAYGGAFPVTDLAAYNATKAGVVSLTQSAAGDLLRKNIRVNCLLPGILSHKFEPDRGPEKSPVLGAYPGWPEEVARAALFLASDDARWITGAALLVDGGLMVDRKRL